MRREDERPVEPEAELGGNSSTPPTAPTAPEADAKADVIAPKSQNPEDVEDEYILKPIPDKLTTELTVWRTLALRRAIGENPDLAFLAALHALCLRAFHRYSLDTCLDLELRSFALGTLGDYRFGDTELARSFDDRHRRWTGALPKEPQDLWAALVGFDLDSRQTLFAHCVSLSLNGVFEPFNRRPRSLAHADRLAASLVARVLETWGYF